MTDRYTRTTGQCNIPSRPIMSASHRGNRSRDISLAQRLCHTQQDIQLITPRGTFFLPANTREKRFLEGRMFLLFERMQNLVIFCESSTCETICGHIQKPISTAWLQYCNVIVHFYTFPPPLQCCHRLLCLVSKILNKEIPNLALFLFSGSQPWSSIAAAGCGQVSCCCVGQFAWESRALHQILSYFIFLICAVLFFFCAWCLVQG